MISVSNVTMRYGSKLLFEDVSVTFTTGRRYGLTGPNGAGKSTFMKVLTGEIDAQKGTVVRPRKIGVLKQDQYEFDAYRVIDTVIMGNKALWAALEEREVIYDKPEMTDEDGSRLGELEGIVGDEDGYEAEANAAVLLQGLDIPDELHERKMSELQGGQKVRVLLAQALFGNPEGPAPRRAHQLPRSRLHPLARRLPHPLQRHRHHHLARPPLPQQRLHPHRRHRLRDHHHLHRRLRRHGPAEDLASAPASRARTSSAKRRSPSSTTSSPASPPAPAPRRSTRARRKSSASPPPSSPAPTSRGPSSASRCCAPPASTSSSSRDVNKSYTQPDGKTEHVINNFSASVMRGDKVVLIGRNGQGKTTLLKALLANGPGIEETDVSIDSGTVKWGHEAQIGYFAQDHKGSIQLGMTAADWLHQFDPKATKEDIRGILGQMLFRGEEGLKKTDALSGGEAARLLFCKIMLQKPNVLVLDEPTNHLDLESINALNQAIQKYEGTVFLVTHDQDLIEEAGTRIWHFEGGPTDFHITDHKGPYEEYQQQLQLAAK